MKESKLNASLKKDLLLVQKKMTPEGRLNAFFTHSQLLMRLFEAGEYYRKCKSTHRILLNSARKKSGAPRSKVCSSTLSRNPKKAFISRAKSPGSSAKD